MIMVALAREFTCASAGVGLPLILFAKRLLSCGSTTKPVLQLAYADSYSTITATRETRAAHLLWTRRRNGDPMVRSIGRNTQETAMYFSSTSTEGPPSVATARCL